MMRVMYVYRLEDADGLGPYATGHAYNFALCGKQHPDPKYDIKGWNAVYTSQSMQYHFGFRTLDDLTEWFYARALTGLYSRGQRIVKYKISKWDVLMGTRQLAFEKRKAEKVKTYDKLSPRHLKN
jgi:hypothetical protein